MFLIHPLVDSELRHSLSARQPHRRFPILAVLLLAVAANATARETFLSNPEKYVPQYDGFCAEGMSKGKHYPGDPTSFVVHDGKTYLFFNAEAKVRFQVDPTALIKKADANWTEYQSEEKARLRQLLDGWRE